MTAITIQPVSVAGTGPAPAVRGAGLGKTIDERPILVGLDFAVPPGRFVALLGANGAGKTTLLKVMATLVPATSGSLFLFGRRVGRDTAALRARIGMIGHASMLYRDLSILENLVFCGRLYDLPDPRGRAWELLDYVGLTARGHDAVKTLSRGMTQRAAIARALMHDPEILLADEPFTGLDAPSRAMLEQMLHRIHGEGKTIVLANHDLDQSLALSEQAIVLRGGRIVLDEPAPTLAPQRVLEEICGP